MYEFDIKLNEEVLKELEKSFQEGRIDQATYEQLKKRYEKKLNDAKMGIDRTEQPVSVKVSGVQTSSGDTLRFAGSASLSGGKISKFISISGSGKINGDIECEGIKSSGSLRSLGSITSHGDIKSSGSFTCDSFLLSEGNAKFSSSAVINGDVNIIGYLKCSGSFRCNGNLASGYGAKFSGSCGIGGDATIKGDLKSSGSFRCAGDVLGGHSMKGSGSVNIDGKLDFQKQIELSGRFFIGKDIIGENLILGMKYGMIERRIFKKLHRSTVNGSVFGKQRIEADNILVRKNVLAPEVIIGPNSEIEGKIYYVNTIQVHDKASIASSPVGISSEELIAMQTNTQASNDIIPKNEQSNLPSERHCPACGFKMERNDESFCPECGFELN